MEQHNADTPTSDFAALFEKHLSKPDRFEPGQLVKTHIAAISNDCVFLELGGKSEGVLEKAELTDAEGKLTVKEGDPINAFFLRAKNGELIFTTKIAGDQAGSAILENAFKNKIPVEGLVEKEIKGGYEIKLGDTRAFCPYSQMGQKRSEAKESYVGKRLNFKIQEYRDNGRSILVSHRIILEEAYQERVKALKQTLRENMTVKAMITSIQDFGAFADLDGVQALLPASEIAWDRVEDLHGVLTVGQEIEASILKLDWANDRITLSLKSLLEDPWTGAAEKYPKDSKHIGKVVRTTNFGAFVSLESGLDGLIHISEFKSDSQYGNAGVPVKKGDSLTVQILDVDPVARRIALKPTSSLEEDATAKKFLENESDSDTYNPFAALLKKK